MEYLPLLLTFAFAAGVAGALLGIPALIAPRRLTPVKLEPFECGKDPIAVSEGRFPIKFSTVAILTLGQYLRPSAQHLPVEKYYHPDEFAELAGVGRELGFSHVESGPLVRSSYHAKRQADQGT